MADKDHPFKIVIDTREQNPYPFSGWDTVRETLDTGDISILGLTNLITIERKSLNDFVGCVGKERERFVKELQRMKAYKFSAVIIEDSLKNIHKEKWKAEKIYKEHVLNSIASWRIKYGVHFVYAENREYAEYEVICLLKQFYKYLKDFITMFHPM